MQVLIVDDSRAMRMIVRKTLKSSGYGHYRVREAVDGVDALHQVREESPSLILCDWNMPRMNGQEFLKALQADEYEGVIGVISSAVSPEQSIQARELGASFVVAKPFKVSTFVALFSAAGLEPSTAAEFESLAAHSVRAFNIKGLRGVLSGVYRREIEITEVDEMDLRRVRNTVVGTYLDIEGNIAGIGVLEMAIGLSLAGALSLIPVGLVRDQVKSRGPLPENLTENLTEVFNLMSGLLVDDSDFRMRIDKIEPRLPRVPVRLRLGAKKGRRLDAHVRVEGYDEGALSLLMLDKPIRSER